MRLAPAALGLAMVICAGASASAQDALPEHAAIDLPPETRIACYGDKGEVSWPGGGINLAQFVIVENMTHRADDRQITLGSPKAEPVHVALLFRELERPPGRPGVVAYEALYVDGEALALMDETVRLTADQSDTISGDRLCAEIDQQVAAFRAKIAKPGSSQPH